MESAHMGQIRGNHGFSLVELMVTLFIFGVVMAVALGYMYRIHHGLVGSVVKAEAQQNSRMAVDLMATELRQAGYHGDPDIANAMDVVLYARPYFVQVQADYLETDEDEPDLLTYDFRADTLYRTLRYLDSEGWHTVTDVIADGVREQTFSYYRYNVGNLIWEQIPYDSLFEDSDWLDSIRAIGIQINAADRQGEIIGLETWVLLRNPWSREVLSDES